MCMQWMHLFPEQAQETRWKCFFCVRKHRFSYMQIRFMTVKSLHFKILTYYIVHGRSSYICIWSSSNKTILCVCGGMEEVWKRHFIESSLVHFNWVEVFMAVRWTNIIKMKLSEMWFYLKIDSIVRINVFIEKETGRPFSLQPWFVWCLRLLLQQIQSGYDFHLRLIKISRKCNKTREILEEKMAFCMTI